MPTRKKAPDPKVEHCGRCGVSEDDVLTEGGLVKSGRDWFCIAALSCERRYVSTHTIPGIVAAIVADPTIPTDKPRHVKSGPVKITLADLDIHGIDVSTLVVKERARRRAKAAQEAPNLPAVGSTPTAGATTYATREEWMVAAVHQLEPLFLGADVELPAVRISVGWPGGKGDKRFVVGQCWMAEAVADGQPAIFVSPVQDNPADVLETIAHELIHAVGNRGHRGGFVKLARAIGFTAPWKSTPASPELKARLHSIAEELGPWPHSKITAQGGVGGRPPVQSTRMLKVFCSECGYTIRTTAKWLAAGIPNCPNSECPAVEEEMVVQVKA